MRIHDIRRFWGIVFLVLVLLGIGWTLNQNFLCQRRTSVKAEIRGKLVAWNWRCLPHDAEEKLARAIKLSYIGDLILLRDAVENGFDIKTKTYSYDDVFAWMRSYWKTDDLTLAVFEGPMAGPDNAYSTSDYDDGVPLRLNFPDAYGDAVKKAGVDYVTLANNHLLDQGLKGMLRTLDRLDEISLNHGGAFRNQKEKDAIKVLEVRGKKLAVLEYTYGSNYYSEQCFFAAQTSYITRPIVSVNSECLEACERDVRRDMANARALGVDAIIVMPHVGGQFLHDPDSTQKYWCDVFVEEGANIVLSDHAHAVQPIEWRKGASGQHVLIVHCPGNFVNSYAPYDGDASYMAEIYLDPETAKPMASGVVPIYGYGAPGGNFAGIPIYEAVCNESFMEALSRNDFRRLQDVQRLVTRVVLGQKIELSNAAKRYYLFPTGEKFRPAPTPVDLAKVPADSPFMRELVKARKICFVGDSVTEGTKNHGVGWFEPLVRNFPEKQVTCFARGSMTSKWFRDKRVDIAAVKADLYVMAFGCNDIRYRDPRVCAMNADDYVVHCKDLVLAIKEQNPQARVVFVSPWESADNDTVCKVPLTKKNALYLDYAMALEKVCRESGWIYLNPNNYIWSKIGKNTWGKGGYMIDYVHPGSVKGCRLYSEACLWTK